MPASRRVSAMAKQAPAPATPLYAAEDFSLLAPQPPSELMPGPAAAPDSHPRTIAPLTSPVSSKTDEPAGSGVTPDSPFNLHLPAQDAPVSEVPHSPAPDVTQERPFQDFRLEPLTPPAPGAAMSEGARSVPAQRAADSGAGASPARTEAEAAPWPVFSPSLPPSTVGTVVIPSALPRDDVADEAKAAVLPGGYELPSADLHDDANADTSDTPSFESTVPAELTPMGYPALELPVKPVAAGFGDAPAQPGSLGLPDISSALSAPSPVSQVPQRAAEPLPPVDYVEQSRAEESSTSPGTPPLALVEDDSPAAALKPKRRKSSSVAEADDDPPHSPQEEVSFVVAARRKAFWRRPGVRATLAMLLLGAMLLLALQVAVHERDRIAAMNPGARPWLVQLCAQLQCEIAPRRQISDVIIDSSSFNKARGDSYQLTLAMKSKAGIPLAMPAVELTLTDAQDQPVLRRVLLPNDMGAPPELPALGEWSTAVSVVVTTGGARVAGYRLLAFYP